ncbi:aldehyde dehydrogenase family protein [Nocardioides sp. YIM B13467]|uniref:aldehyde dehydrogenase family protein n=1 Tax=Nocardioides sp. YIM B13467 TaxID=3366294 RepID=UPI00366E02A6
MSANGVLASKNPYDSSDLIGEFALTTGAQVSEIVETARRAGREWREQPATVRADSLYAAAAALEANRDQVAHLVVREVGKPITEAQAEVKRGIDILRYHAGGLMMPSGDVLPGSTARGVQFTTRRPLGTVAVVTPWNFPVAIPLWKLVPALAWGNGVVLKPSSEAVGVASRLVEILAPHFPVGLLRLAIGGKAVVDRLLDDDGADAISFTGSTPVGLSLVKRAAARAVPCQTEMGGSNPTVVLADADLQQAVAAVAGSSMAFAGQKCTATSRIIVEASVYDAFRDQLTESIRTIPVGDPFEAKTVTGPVIGASALAEALNAVKQSGGKTLTGAEADVETNVLSPTLVEVDPGVSDVLLQQEVFAPVAALVRADDAKQAMAIAADTPFGLSAGLFTSDVASVLDFIGSSEVGMVRVNAPTTGVDFWAPFGGMKSSSYGAREQGPAAKDFFTHGVTVFIDG